MSRVAVIGTGAIGRAVLGDLVTTGGLELAAVSRAGSAPGQALPDGVLRLEGLEALIAFEPDLVVEAAGAEAVATYLPPLLERGASVLVSSVGALADDALFDTLRSAAERSGGHVLVPSGAVAGLDYLHAVRRLPGTRVRYESRKPPSAWADVLAREGIDPQAMQEPLTLFSGSAREAARLYPQNLNVAATLALAGVGMEDTVVSVVVDPRAEGNTHSVQVEGPAGTLALKLVNRPSRTNPKTSQVVASSILAAIEKYFSPTRVG